MKIPDLMARLDAQWPFKDTASMKAASEDYRAVLGRYEGARLQQAWTETVAAHTDFARPKPSDILGRIPAAAEKSAGLNMRDHLSRAKAIAAELRAAWFRDNQQLVDEFCASYPEGDRAFVLGKFSFLVDRLAWECAQHQAFGRSSYVVISQGDLDGIRKRIASQPVPRNSIIGELRPIHVPMQRQQAKEEGTSR